jgi:osmotically-inducible protein OsmY
MRTDVERQIEVAKALCSEPAVDAASIDVQVRGGMVSLAGHVGSFAESWYAQRAALRVPGVQALAAELDVQLPLENEREDDDITRAASQVLWWTTSLPKGSVNVLVQGGWLTLTGEVNWDHERRAAVAAVRLLAGLRGVTDLIRLRAHVSRSAVKADIDVVLRRVACGSMPKVVVEVHGAQVTLTGEVHNWAERALVQRSAWGTPGVYNVVDTMTLAA